MKHADQKFRHYTFKAQILKSTVLRFSANFCTFFVQNTIYIYIYIYIYI